MNNRELNKKGISEILSYVLLIVIAISISVLVYSYLKGQVPKGAGTTCDEGTSLVIQDYSCDLVSHKLNLTLENHGRFSVEGFTAKLGNSTSKIAGCKPKDVNNSDGTFYFIGLPNASLEPGITYEKTLMFANCYQGDISFIEIVPINSKGVLCNNAVTHDEIRC